MAKENPIIKNLIENTRRNKVHIPKPERVIDKIYSCKNIDLQRTDLLSAYKVYSDYCDPRGIEFNPDQELEIMEGIILGIDYSVYFNIELSANIMERVKELLIVGVDIKKTFNKQLITPEDSLHILDISIRVKKGEELL